RLDSRTVRLGTTSNTSWNPWRRSMVVQHDSWGPRAMPDLDLDDLERKARAASPGPWWRCTCCSMLYRHDGETDGARDYIAEARGLKNRSAANADYIAAMNPAVALELIERVRRAEARASAWKRLAKRLRARVRISA